MYYSGGGFGTPGESRILGTKFTGLDQSGGDSEFTSHIRPWVDYGNGRIVPPPVYLRVQRTGSNLVYSASLDGASFITALTQAANTWFSVEPDLVGPSISSTGAGVLATFDWIRKTA